MIAIPGDTKATTISGMIADEMAIGMVNQKTTAARLIPAVGKRCGRQSGIWRIVWICPGYAGKQILL